jgi:hypothetical protein
VNATFWNIAVGLLPRERATFLRLAGVCAELVALARFAGFTLEGLAVVGFAFAAGALAAPLRRAGLVDLGVFTGAGARATEVLRFAAMSSS